MKNIKYIIGFFLLALFVGCGEESYQFGDLSAPSNMVINTEIVGQSDATPNGDGSGEVIIAVTADNAITYHIGYNKLDDYGDVNLAVLKGGTVNKKFTDPGTNTYRITVVAYGKGGVSSNLTKDIMVRSDFVPAASIVTNLTNGSSKAWIVDKSVTGHLGVGPWENFAPIWWTAGVDEKLACCGCFYSTKFTFTKNANGTFSLNVNAPDGVFTKTGALTNLPGIPASGDEGCYSEYTGGTSGFNFVPASTGIPASQPSTQTSIKLADRNTVIGYGATLDEYEILEITENYMYLRVQGTETGNSWYLKLKPAP
ncbi:hypothetical protein [Mariniflexile sp.]|uniref:hypothetical protein n=1 Tax=Mariniflexile sp. TaxID=1979402 RepID=UPI00404707A0